MEELPRTDREDDRWDLMEHHYVDHAALLYAIICLVNNWATRDAYTYFSARADVPIEKAQSKKCEDYMLGSKHE